MKPWILVLLAGASLLGAERVPMVANFKDSAAYRWLDKKVLESRLLDDMHSLEKWQTFVRGPEVITASGAASKDVKKISVAAEISLTKENSRDGGSSLRLRMPAKLDMVAPNSGLAWGETGVIRRFDGEDWTKFNRISLWIRPDWPGAYVIPIEALRIFNDGVEKLPAARTQEGEHTLMLRNHEWNHVVWEIGNVARDKVTAFQIDCEMDGNEPDMADSVIFDLSRLELERVEPDYIEGWKVWPGRISYSHAGYQTGATKSAIANGLAAKEFRLIDEETGETVLSKQIENAKTHLGEFQVMDFSEVRRPGSYVLQAGDVSTRPFRIDLNVWRESILKALNFFYTERCGMAIPGVHGVCHRDWIVTHDGKTLSINGGWHDAGDLSQGLFGSGEITYALLNLAERLQNRAEDPELYERVLEEGLWGLNWLLKTRFGDGYRGPEFASNGRRTNGIQGDFDDIIAKPSNDAFGNLIGAVAEATAYRLLKQRDPRLAEYSLKSAIEDWQFAMAGLAKAVLPSKQLWRGTGDSGDIPHEVYSEAVVASIELFRATGDQRYADKAVELARPILDSQQRERTDWPTSFSGFFYTNPAKDRVLHYSHQGREHLPSVALRRLCDALPDHPDWMKWYSALMLHSEYLKAGAKYTEPYGMLASSIYSDTEYQMVPQDRRESFRKEVLNGVPLGAGHYLRLFPAWVNFRGNNGCMLAQTMALSNAAHVRGDFDAVQLAEKELEWVIGRNPFSESMMWGEGYDYAPLYTPLSGTIVGGLPVGIETRGDNDVPYWPVQAVWTYKEIWQYPVARWMFLMKELAGPALVEGQAGGPVSFKEVTSGQVTLASTDLASGHFRIMLPEGKYTVQANGQEETRTFLPGEAYSIDLRSGRTFDFDVSAETSKAGDVTIKVSARGTGNHRFAFRADNVTLTGGAKDLTLGAGTPGTLEWRGRVASADTPWVAVVIPDDDLAARKEVRGTTWEQ